MTNDMEARCERYRDQLKYQAYASIVPDRRPEVKFHVGLHRAKTAVGYVEFSGARGGEIYEMTPDGWALLYRVEYGTSAEKLPWKRESA